MSSSRLPRRRLLAALIGASLTGGLAGCFRPMLAEDTTAAAIRGRIALPPIDGRFGYHLVGRLEERLGAPRDPEYRLEVSLTSRDRGLAITQDNTVTRRRLETSAVWRVVPRGETTPVLRGRDIARSGYNATSSLYATRAAAETAERRLAEVLAERISREILARADLLTPAAG